jgi:hypothetical protein
MANIGKQFIVSLGHAVSIRARATVRHAASSAARRQVSRKRRFREL